MNTEVQVEGEITAHSIKHRLTILWTDRQQIEGQIVRQMHEWRDGWRDCWRDG